MRDHLVSVCLSCSLSCVKRESTTFHSSFIASHKVPALTEEKICVSSSLLRSALPTSEAAPAACQTPHRYGEVGDKYKLLFSEQRGGGGGKQEKPLGLQGRVKPRQVT